MSEEPTWDDYLNAYLGPLKEKIEKLEKWKENQENIDKAIRFEINKNIPKLKESILKAFGIESIKKELSELKEQIKRLSGATDLEGEKTNTGLIGDTDKVHEPIKEVIDSKPYNPYDAKSILLEPYQVVVEKKDIEEINELNYLSFKEKYLEEKKNE